MKIRDKPGWYDHPREHAKAGRGEIVYPGRNRGGPKVRATKNNVIVRVKDPKRFQQDSFRTIDPGRPGHTKMTVGRLKGKKTTEVQRIIIPKKDAMGMSYSQLKHRGVNLPPRGDIDGDRAPNARDCCPLNPIRQDEIDTTAERFFEERFHRPAKRTDDYFLQWLSRFRGGHPETYMDSESLEAYERVKRNKATYDKMDEINKKYSSKPSKSEEIFQKSTWTEADVNLIKNRLNSGKLKEYSIPEGGVGLTADQNQKGRDWLMNQWKTPAGKERTNNPFGFREQDVLEHFKEIRLIDFYDTAKYGQNKWVVPYYRVEATDGGSFEYALYGGKISIMG